MLYGAIQIMPKIFQALLKQHVKSLVCTYEYNTDWGKKIVLMYGSTTEDIFTGLAIQPKGWRSLYYSPNPPAFLGCAPSGGPASMTQQKRWATGLLEVLVSKKNPIYGTLFKQLNVRQCLGYLWILTWALRSIPEFLYALLPAYCIMTNSHFLPKLLGLSETIFEVIKKDQSTSSDDISAKSGRFTFDESPVFVPGTTLLLVHLMAVLAMLLGLRPQTSINNGSGLGEVVCTVWLLLCFWPFLRGLYGKGKYGIPYATIIKGAILATVFTYLCIMGS